MQLSKLNQQLAYVWRSHKSEAQLHVLIIVALFFGGGGAAYGLFNLAVQLVSLSILATNFKEVCRWLSRQSALFTGLLCATLLLPLIQLVPLPPNVWQLLPGRDLLAESLLLIGKPNAWYPISLAPSRTFIAFLSLIPVLTTIFLASELDDRAILRVFGVIVFVAVLLLMLGGAQLFTANERFLLFRGRINSTALYSNFANHNTAGLFYCLALLFATRIGLRSNDVKVQSFATRYIIFSIYVAFSFGVILTQSRSSIGLLFIIVTMRMIFFWPRWRQSLLRTSLFALIILVAAGAGLGILQGHSRLGDSLARFSNLSDARPAIWVDTLSSISRFWPAGSGISSFSEVFEVDETLEHVWEFHAGRAHNDYLEVVQEAGVAGAVLLLCWAAWLTKRARLTLRKRPVDVTAAIAIFSIFIVALQSIVDYPLRNQAILCLVGLAVGLLSACEKRTTA